MEKVKIPKKFKDSLEKRFDINRFSYDARDKVYVAKEIPCPLCKELKRCTMCPFDRFRDGLSPGCLKWLDDIQTELGIEEDCLYLFGIATVLTYNITDFERLVNEAAKRIEFV